MKQTNLIRLNRFLSMCGISSRRKADELIRTGKVKVNGRISAELGVRIDPSKDKVHLEGKQVSFVREHQYIVLNKPKDTITTLHDERGRHTVIDLVRSKQRVYPVGRLDRNTTGVLLLTSDGEFANELMHPRFGVPKTYHVRCETEIEVRDLARLRKGIRLSDGVTGPARAGFLSGGKRRDVRITIHEGRNKQVRRMFEALGYSVKNLDRTAYGPITYEGLRRGASRRLTPREIRSLRRVAQRSDA